MNTSLKHFDGVFIIPVLQVFWTFFAVLDGFMYFQDYRSYTAGRLLGFIRSVLLHTCKPLHVDLSGVSDTVFISGMLALCSGVLIIFYGVYLLCPDKDDKSPKVGRPTCHLPSAFSHTLPMPPDPRC